MMSSKSTLTKGSIWLIEFPFSELRTTKIRPVVVLHHDPRFEDVLVAAISSVITSHERSYAVHITAQDQFFANTGLRKSSVIHCTRQVTLNKSRLFHQLGVLSQSSLEALDQTLISLLELGGSKVSQYSEQSGSPSPKPIPYARQSINAEDMFAVLKTLRSDFLTQGPKVPEFEKAVGEYCNAGQAVAVNSGTSALHLACLALGLGPKDELWTSPITFVASANCALYCGASVDFVDIDPRTYNLCPQALEKKLLAAQQSGKLPKVVVPVHFSGQPCDMEAIQGLGRQYDFRILEDASHALGARFKDEPIGNCKFSDVTVFSFHPVKSIATGEGGMALTNDKGLAEKMTLLRSHGIIRSKEVSSHNSEVSNQSFVNQSRSRDKGPPAWYYEQIDLGFNYRMTDIQASMGLSQLKRLDAFVIRRRELARRYDEHLADFPVITPWQHPDVASAWHLYVVRLQLDKLRITHRQVFETMREQGIGVNLHYIPVHTQPWFRRLGFKYGDFPEAEKYYQEALTFPLFPAMTEEQQDNVVHALRIAISGRS
jgi:UDP-4-amino-4,6-dideoxy-N-acetyl-beta-L-altrosamine transaminase